MNFKVNKRGNAASSSVPGGLAGWLLARWRNRQRAEPRLALLERITLAPRQTLCLVEAEGRRFLVASSAEGAPAFYPLEGKPGAAKRNAGPDVGQRRVSW